MPCDFHSDGSIATIVCTRGTRQRQCTFCGRRSTKLCDYPVTRDGKQGTCDRPCCNTHAFSHGLNVDYCLTHHNFIEKQNANQADS